MGPPQPFENWARTVRATPAAVFRPADEAALVAMLARTGSRRVRVVGSRHSWSSIARPEDVLLDLGAMDAPLAVDVDRQEVRVQAGCPLWLVVETLAACGFALPILGSIAEQTAAGAVSTGTHGSSLVHPPIGGGLRRARLVDAAGEVREVDRDDPLMDGVRCGLGALGILTEMTFGIEPVFHLEEVLEPMAVAAAFAEVEAIAASAEYVKLWWLPHTGRAQVFRYSRVPGQKRASTAARAFDEVVVNGALFAGLLGAGGLRPRWVPAINRLVGAAYFRAARRQGRSDELLTVAMPPRHRETECAVALADAPAVLEALLRTHRDEGLYVDFVTEIRFSPADRAWLSPAYGRDTAWIGAYAAKTPDTDRWFQALHAAGAPYGGRPHWGKEIPPDTELDGVSYPQLSRFQAAREAADPGGRLRNALLDRLFAEPPERQGADRPPPGG